MWMQRGLEHLQSQQTRPWGFEWPPCVRSMVSQKRRAIADLMKELQRLGVSQNPKPDTLACQWSRAKLFQFSIWHPRFDSILLSSTHRSNHYYHSLIDGLQAVQDIVGSHHSDFTTRDIHHVLLTLFRHDDVLIELGMGCWLLALCCDRLILVPGIRMAARSGLHFCFSHSMERFFAVDSQRNLESLWQNLKAVNCFQYFKTFQNVQKHSKNV